eukprot:TRINITY_DN5983_c0_g1_i1.p1 TRINITY_DN5983_c0_g1~~TRINITY_DN5983_c0_g1_i1.p1  ORF type:complete len:464 (-),score=49.12 TRINITY_DN5983_c0_g1_i1:169-1560(-)
MASKKSLSGKATAPFEVREVADDTRKGRGVFATRDFKFGDVIMMEKDAVLAQEQYVDPPLPFLVCEHCLSYVGSIEMQLEIMASDLEVDPIAPEWFETFKTMGPKLPAYKSCEDCGAAFCEEKCFDTAQALYHRRLCPRLLNPVDTDECRALQKFWELDSQTPNLKLAFAAKFCAMLLHEMETNKLGLAEARTNVVGRWHTMPYSLQHILQQRASNMGIKDDELVSYLSSPVSEAEQTEAKLFSAHVLDEARYLLLLTMAKDFPSHVGEALFSADSFDRLLGVVHLNNVEVQIFSPIHRFLKDCMSKDRHQAEPLLSLVSQVASRYGGDLPVCKGGALFKNYAMANHSCSFNVVPRRSLEEEMFLPDQCATTCFVASTAVKKGSELCLPYIDPRGKNRAQRQRELWQKYAFLCQCPSCSCSNPACVSLDGKGASFKCARCKKVTYCSSTCQKADWKSHRTCCQ